MFQPWLVLKARIHQSLYNGFCTCMNLTYLLQVCQSLEAGRWLEEEKFEMTDSFPSAKVSH